MNRLAQVFLAVAVMALCARHLRLDLAPFINDEPGKLAAAWMQAATKTWVVSEPNAGTQGALYGPFSLWFYALVQRVLDARPETSILCAGVALTVAQLLMVWGLCRRFGQGAGVGALLVLWLAASPYQFFWSRVAWELGTNISCSLAVAVLTWNEAKWSWGRALLLGLCLAVGVLSHLMVVPFVAAAFALVVFENRGRLKNAAVYVGLMATAIGVVNARYFRRYR